MRDALSVNVEKSLGKTPEASEKPSDRSPQNRVDTRRALVALSARIHDPPQEGGRAPKGGIADRVRHLGTIQLAVADGLGENIDLLEEAIEAARSHGPEQSREGRALREVWIGEVHGADILDDVVMAQPPEDADLSEDLVPTLLRLGLISLHGEEGSENFDSLHDTVAFSEHFVAGKAERELSILEINMSRRGKTQPAPVEKDIIVERDGVDGVDLG